MEKILLTAIVVLFTVATSAKTCIIKPNNWKVGDSLSYSLKNSVSSADLSFTIQSVENDKYVLNQRLPLLDSVSLKNNIFLNDSLANVLNSFVCKIAVQKSGEFIKMENRDEFNAMLDSCDDGLLVNMIKQIANGIDDGHLFKTTRLFWYMNKEVKEGKESVFKRDIVVNNLVYKDVDVKVSGSAQDGKVTFVSTAELTQDLIVEAQLKRISSIQKNLSETMIETIMKSERQQDDHEVKEFCDSFFKDNPQLKNIIESIKKQKMHQTVRETAVFDEKTGWAISIETVCETSVNDGMGITIIKEILTAK